MRKFVLSVMMFILLLTTSSTLVAAQEDTALTETSRQTLADGSEFSMRYPLGWFAQAENNNAPILYFVNDTDLFDTERDDVLVAGQVSMTVTLFLGEDAISVEDYYQTRTDAISEGATISELDETTLASFTVSNPAFEFQELTIYQAYDGYAVEARVYGFPDDLTAQQDLLESMIASAVYIPAGAVQDSVEAIQETFVSSNQTAVSRLTETYELELRDSSGFVFNYPTDWVALDFDSIFAYVLTSESLSERLQTAEGNLELDDDELVISIRIIEDQQSIISTPDELYEVIVDSYSDDEGTTISDLEQVTLNGDVTALFTLTDSEFTYTTMIIARFSDGYAVEATVAGPAETLEVNRELILAIVASVEYTPAED